MGQNRNREMKNDESNETLIISLLLKFDLVLERGERCCFRCSKIEIGGKFILCGFRMVITRKNTVSSGIPLQLSSPRGFRAFATG
jgi:hypothetical protein